MVRVTFCLKLLLLVFILRQSAADFDHSSDPGIEIEPSNEDPENPLATQTVMKCHTETGKKFKAKIVDVIFTEESNQETVEELREKLKQLQATIGQQRKTEEASNQTIQEMKKEVEQLQATTDRQTKTVETIIQSQKSVCGNTKNVCQYLLQAAKSGEVTTARILVKRTNDNCTTHDNLHYTPLMFATANGHVDLVRALLEGGASVETTNDYQWTALHVAAFYGHLDMCHLLLEKGAMVDPLDVMKETPLHHAALNGHLSVLKLLVEKGANVKLKNYDAQTASDMARSEGYSDVADWLDTQKVQ